MALTSITFHELHHKMLALKKKREQQQLNGGNSNTSARVISGAQIRVQKDVTELELPPTIELQFDNPNDLLHFTVTIKPADGLYKGGVFPFSCEISEDYPIKPPKFLCIPKIYHPNIDLEGNVCLNILREDWKPILSLTSILLGLQILFLEPNPNDPLNKEAATELARDRHKFSTLVKRSMLGGYVGEVRYDQVLRR
ncbi:unnamed protein product [Kuraishia capsulata CBS 1993]|uniref:NEDD8-conjugating enzyme UBC12 n=1 Tax=Kuraishia capsulata CBS 1993 TaxID=1382522 RepID=W6MP92_9ASCO|nr:uncharacterized protein KUCA_T00002894001 [Kuraishia capsulata CBS 1993]CDK26917.1 unnamed protein product [Kuraishia capsulata CBS 1993]